VVGPFLNDEFGDTFGIIYGFTADGFTDRELRDYVEDIRSKLLGLPDVSKIAARGPTSLSLSGMIASSQRARHPGSNGPSV
jgi:multidrug efflux pump subunit AcrB